jgi:uncharacterized membrane protein
MALIFDVIYFATDNDAFATAAFWGIAAGIIGGLLAAVWRSRASALGRSPAGWAARWSI